MKKLFITIFILGLICPSAFAYKIYTYDETGKRVYFSVKPEDYAINKSRKSSFIYNGRGNRLTRTSTRGDRTYVYDSAGKKLTYSRCANGRVYVYDQAGKKVRTYSMCPNNRIYVYDANGKKIKTYSKASNGRTYVYGPDGQRIKTYSKASNGRLYVYENGNHKSGNNPAGGTRTFVTTDSRAYSHQFKGSGGSFSSRPSRGGTSIVATNRALYRYGY